MNHSFLASSLGRTHSDSASKPSELLGLPLNCACRCTPCPDATPRTISSTSSANGGGKWACQWVWYGVWPLRQKATSNASATSITAAETVRLTAFAVTPLPHVPPHGAVNRWENNGMPR